MWQQKQVSQCGSYLVNEESVISGYLLNTETKTVTLRYKDQVTPIIYSSLTVSNDEPTRKFRDY
ncbi:MAG: hypothetical protein HFJ51_00960 [Clostridia bacterium]|nr:hypothetical protein [Clostridia bacterium]